MSTSRLTTVLVISASVAATWAFGAPLTGGCAFAAPDVPAMAPGNTQLKTLYWQGHEALQVADWDAALTRFIDLERRLRDSNADAADAAVYWQAYTLVQSKRLAEARRTVERLHRAFPQSRWADEADGLVGRKPGGSVQASGAGDVQAELTIERALAEPDEQAAQSLREVINGSYSIRIKKRALFVLSQLGDANSPAYIAEVAKGLDPELRREAIQMLGVSGAGTQLRDIYKASASADTRRAVLRAFGVAGAVSDLAAVAESNADVSLRRAAIENLGVAGGTERLVALYGTASTPELRRAVLDALRVSADSKTLLDLYERAKTPEQKRALMRIQEEISDDDSGEK